jgi:Zn finger protein HypA/HybF involved in hydrogenase expression
MDSRGQGRIKAWRDNGSKSTCKACGEEFKASWWTVKLCPKCKGKPPLAAAEGVIELSGFRVRVILEPIT